MWVARDNRFMLCLSFVDARSCVTCDTVLAELEKIDDDTDSFGVDFVKINDKRLAKQYGIKNFPALTYFRYEFHSFPIVSQLIVKLLQQGERTDHLRGRSYGRGRRSGLLDVLRSDGPARPHRGSELENLIEDHRGHGLRRRSFLWVFFKSADSQISRLSK